ncbi:MAG: hypothetical protein ACJAVK_000026 [Akkermansiaceae bacterium]|jgi:hypothetical protein
MTRIMISSLLLWLAGLGITTAPTAKKQEKEKLAGVIIWEIGQTPTGENSILKLFPRN